MSKPKKATTEKDSGKVNHKDITSHYNAVISSDLTVNHSDFNVIDDVTLSLFNVTRLMQTQKVKVLKNYQKKYPRIIRESEPIN